MTHQGWWGQLRALCVESGKETVVLRTDLFIYAVSTIEPQGHALTFRHHRRVGCIL